MERECCAITVTELENGYRLKIRGDAAELKALVQGCCGGKPSSCCGPDANGTMDCGCCRLTVTPTPEGLEVAYEGDKNAAKERLRSMISGCCK